MADVPDQADPPDIAEAVRQAWAADGSGHQLIHLDDDVQHLVVADADGTWHQVPVGIGATVEFGEPDPIIGSAAVRAFRSTSAADHLTESLTGASWQGGAAEQSTGDVVAHLPGRHDQKAHGRRFNIPGDPASGLRPSRSSRNRSVPLIQETTYTRTRQPSWRDPDAGPQVDTVENYTITGTVRSRDQHPASGHIQLLTITGTDGEQVLVAENNLVPYTRAMPGDRVRVETVDRRRDRAGALRPRPAAAPTGSPFEILAATAEEAITLPNPNPTIIHAAAAVSVDDVRTAYYRQAPQQAWIREFHTEPKRLIVANDADGSVAKIDFEVTDDGSITFGAPVAVRVEYVEDEEPEKVAASRMVYASAAESRPSVASQPPPPPGFQSADEGDLEAHASHNQQTHGNRYRGGRLVSGPDLPTPGGRGTSPQNIADDPDVDLDSFVTSVAAMTKRDWDSLTDGQKDSLAEASERLGRERPPNVQRVSDAFQKLGRWERERQRRTDPLRRGVQAATVSDRPWSNFTEADYSPEQWRRATLLDRGPEHGDENTKGRYGLPVREPDGTLNRNGVHAAAGGHGIGAVEGISDELRRSTARKIVRLYRDELGEEPPDSLLSLAGQSMSAAADDPATDPPETPAAEPGNPSNKEDDMPLSTEVYQRLGLAEDAEADAVNAAVLAALDKAAEEPDPQQVAAAAAENEGLQQKVALLEEQVQSLSKQIADDNAAKAAEVKASVIDQAVTKGRIAPADKDKWAERYDKAPDAVADVLASIADGAAVPVTAKGNVGDPWDVAAADLPPEPDWLFSNPEPALVGNDNKED